MADNLPQLSPSQLDTKANNNSLKQISSTLGDNDESTKLKKDSLSGGVGQLKAALRNRLKPSNLTSNPTVASNSNTILSDNNDESASVTYHHKNNGNLLSGSSNHNGNHIQQNRSDLPVEKNSSKKLNNSTLNKVRF